MPTAKEFIRWMFFPVFFRVLRFVVFCGRRALAMFSSYLSVSILWASILCIVEWYQVEVSIHMPTAREFIVDNFSLQFCSCLFGFLPLFPARSLLLLACERIHCAHTLTNMHTHMYTRKQTHPRTHTRAHLHAAHTRARTQHAYTLTRTHTYTNALGAPHTHTHTHTHTHIHTHNTHTHYTEPTSPFAPSRTLRRRSCGRLFSLCGSGALVFTHAHTHTHQRIHTHTHKNLHTYTYTYTHTHTHTRARACTPTLHRAYESVRSLTHIEKEQLWETILIVWLRCFGFLVKPELRNVPPVQAYAAYVASPLMHLLHLGAETFHTELFPRSLPDV